MRTSLYTKYVAARRPSDRACLRGVWVCMPARWSPDAKACNGQGQVLVCLVFRSGGHSLLIFAILSRGCPWRLLVQWCMLLPPVEQQQRRELFFWFLTGGVFVVGTSLPPPPRRKTRLQLPLYRVTIPPLVTFRIFGHD